MNKDARFVLTWVGERGGKMVLCGDFDQIWAEVTGLKEWFRSHGFEKVTLEPLIEYPDPNYESTSQNQQHQH